VPAYQGTNKINKPPTHPHSSLIVTNRGFSEKMIKKVSNAEYDRKKQENI